MFLFPTHSDGFGMTQFEALEVGLPVIASRHCATLVEHGRTGLLLDQVSGTAIANAIRFFLDHPDKLSGMSAAALAASEVFARRSATACLDAMQGLGTLERN